MLNYSADNRPTRSRSANIADNGAWEMLGESGLAYGICVGPTGKADQFALPSLGRIDPTAPVILRKEQTSIHSAYNSMVDEALALGARGLVLLHDDVEIRNPAVPSLLGNLLSDPSIGIVGAIGASNVQSIEWWWYDRHGYVEERDFVADFGRSTVDVDVADGVVLALSREGLEKLRFDAESYPPFHGYDLHICSQAKALGLRVVVTDLGVYHDSYPHGKVTDPEAYAAADRIWRRTWRRGVLNSLRYRGAVIRTRWKAPRRTLARVLRP
jgi:hypothetical protein